MVGLPLFRLLLVCPAGLDYFIPSFFVMHSAFLYQARRTRPRGLFLYPLVRIFYNKAAPLALALASAKTVFSLYDILTNRHWRL
jgi:hypothetical protein